MIFKRPWKGRDVWKIECFVRFWCAQFDWSCWADRSVFVCPQPWLYYIWWNVGSPHNPIKTPWFCSCFEFLLTLSYYEQTMWLVLCTGNDIIHELTSAQNYTLRVELADWEGNSRYAEYSNFKVASASDKYKLTSLGIYSGNAGTTIMSRYSLYLRFLHWEFVHYQLQMYCSPTPIS